MSHIDELFDAAGHALSVGDPDAARLYIAEAVEQDPALLDDFVAAVQQDRGYLDRLGAQLDEDA